MPDAGRLAPTSPPPLPHVVRNRLDCHQRLDDLLGIDQNLTFEEDGGLDDRKLILYAQMFPLNVPRHKRVKGNGITPPSLPPSLPEV